MRYADERRRAGKGRHRPEALRPRVDPLPAHCHRRSASPRLPPPPCTYHFLKHGASIDAESTSTRLRFLVPCGPGTCAQANATRGRGRGTDGKRTRMTRRACGGRRTGVRLNCPPSLRGAHRPLAVALHVRHRTHFKVWSACADSDHCDRRSPALWWAGHHAREHMSEGCSLRRQPANARSRTARERLEPRRPTRVPRLISALYLHSQSSQN